MAHNGILRSKVRFNHRRGSKGKRHGGSGFVAKLGIGIQKIFSRPAFVRTKTI